MIVLSEPKFLTKVNDMNVFQIFESPTSDVESLFAQMS